MKRLDLAEIARADLASIRRYSTRRCGRDQTVTHMDALRDTMKGLVRGAVVTRARHDLRPGIQMATSGRHSIFFEADESRVWSSAFSTTGWTTVATWTVPTFRTFPARTPEGRQAAFRKPSCARRRDDTRKH